VGAAWYRVAGRCEKVGSATVFHPGSGGRGQGAGLAATRSQRSATVSVDLPGPAAQVVADGIAGSVSTSTIRRWLAEDAIKPWQYQSWIFITDPDFAAKAARVLDLYNRVWDGKPLSANDYVVSADEEISIQARCRCHPCLPPGKARMMRVSHDYHRGDTLAYLAYLAYLAAYDVHRANIYGRCEATTGIAPFTALVEQVMTQQLYASADRVFWVVDNGSSHRGQKAIDRLAKQFPNAVMVHTPVHACRLNQVKVYFSILQRKRCPPTTSPTSPQSSNASPDSRSATTRRPNPSNGSSPPTISPTSWNDSTDIKKPRPQAAPNRRQPDPRRTYKSDHLAAFSDRLRRLLRPIAHQPQSASSYAGPNHSPHALSFSRDQTSDL
jgi:DDE superfamily endonuclease